MLAGSDFLGSLKGISFKTAAGFVARRRSLAGALQTIKLEKRWQLACTRVSRVVQMGMRRADNDQGLMRVQDTACGFVVETRLRSWPSSSIGLPACCPAGVLRSSPESAASLQARTG